MRVYRLSDIMNAIFAEGGSRRAAAGGVLNDIRNYPNCSFNNRARNTSNSLGSALGVGSQAYGGPVDAYREAALREAERLKVSPVDIDDKVKEIP